MKHWRSLPPEYGDYEVSRFGSVRNKNTGYTLKPFKHPKGYLQVSLKGVNMLVHRLVAITHLGYSQHSRHVNHKNGDKTNNAVSNLEWSTPSQNNFHYHRNKPPVTTPLSSVMKSGTDPSPDPSLVDLRFAKHRYRQIKNEMRLIKGHIELLEYELDWLFEKLGIQVENDLQDD